MIKYYTLQRREPNAKGEPLYLAPIGADSAYTTDISKAVVYYDKDWADIKAHMTEIVVEI